EDRLFSQILNMTPSPLIVIDNYGQVVLVNDSTEELLGRAKNEMLGQPINRLLPATIWEYHLHIRNGAAKPSTNRKRFSTLCTISTKDGHESPVQIDVSSLKTDIGDFTVAWIHPRTISE